MRSEAQEIPEYANKNDLRKFYQYINELQKKKCAVKDRNGSPLKKFWGAWSEHFMDLLN